MFFRHVGHAAAHSSLLLGAAAMASQERKASRLSIRYGSDNGIMCYTFQLATRSSHNSWLTSLVQGTLSAARNLGQMKTNCVWKKQECQLTIHHDLGFILSEKNSQAEIWKQPFHNLCASNDDGAKLLWLNFRGQEEDELVMTTNPKVVVFTIHNFLSAKLHMMSNKMPNM